MKKLLVVMSACFFLSLSCFAHGTESRSSSEDLDLHSKLMFSKWVKKLDITIIKLIEGKIDIRNSVDRLSSEEFFNRLEDTYTYKKDRSFFIEDEQQDDEESLIETLFDSPDEEDEEDIFAHSDDEKEGEENDLSRFTDEL